MVVNHSARLEGTSKDTLLGLTAAKGWTLNLSGTDTLAARFAQLGNARAAGVPGYAYLSEDVDPALVVTVTPLMDVAGSGNSVAVAKITKKNLIDGDQLEIEIDFTGGGGGPGKGAYQGLAYDATAPEPLAVILALVT